ncbi:MAG: hypothetical protein U0791_19045 [Gemmataceae bacterium]
MTALDTNILVYAFDTSEGDKHRKTKALVGNLVLQSPAPPILWQVLGEFLQRLRRWMEHGLISDTEFESHLHYARTLFRTQLPTPDVIDRALDLTSQFSLSHWDGMLLGACEAAG